MPKRYFLPRIALEDYKDFQTLMKDRLHSSYEEWLDYIEFRRRDELSRGHDVIDVDVFPDELRNLVGPNGSYDYVQLTRLMASKMADKT